MSNQNPEESQLQLEVLRQTLASYQKVLEQCGYSFQVIDGVVQESPTDFILSLHRSLQEKEAAFKQASKQWEEASRQLLIVVEANTGLQKQIADLRDAVKANHKWHEDYDEYGGYPDSELCVRNCQALSLSGGNGYIDQAHAPVNNPK